MNSETMEKNAKEITFVTILTVLKKYLVWILLSTFVLGIVGVLYSAIFQKTKYTATVEFNVVNALSDNEYTSDSMLSAASRIATTCVEIAEKNVLHRAVVESNNIDALLNCQKDEAIKRVADLIKADKGSDDSQIFSVTVTSEDKTLTYVLIKAIQTEMPRVTKDITTSHDTSQNVAVLKVVSEVVGETSIKTIQPSVLRAAIIFAFIGFMLAFAAFLMVYMFDTKVYNEDSVKQCFKYPIIGAIPAWYTQSERALSKKKLMEQQTSITSRIFKDKLISSKNTPFAVTESFNTLRTNLLYSIPAVECPVFLVTSDFSAAGKSIVSSNIAISLAMLGKKVLIVECDMRCPAFSKIFDNNSNVGLSDLISGNAFSSDDAIVKSTVANLDVVYSGRIPPNPSELLSSERMVELINEWKTRYDVIIVDTPPLLEVVDACVLSPVVNGYVLVARSAYSDTKALGEAISAISAVNGNFIGFILNAVDVKDSGEYTKYGKYGKYNKYRRYSGFSETNSDKASEE